MKEIKCEDEKIGFLGKVQNIGFLLIFSSSGNLEAYSDNIEDFIGNIDPNHLIGIHYSEFFERHLTYHGFDPSPVKHEHGRIEFQEFSDILKIGNNEFYLNAYASDDRIFMEFEIGMPQNINLNRILNQKILEIQTAKNDPWTLLSNILSKQLEVDRVMVYQFNEDKSGKVIAETLRTPELDSYLGLNYPEFDIPQQARALYRFKHCRFVVDCISEGSSILGLQSQDIDLSEVSIRRLSPIHLQYLKNGGFRSSISFSIIIEGELWGLVCCQHQEPMHIDLKIRDFCLLAINFTNNKFQQIQDASKLKYLQEVQKLELLLKEKILLKPHIFPELKSFAPTLMRLLASDGMAIVYDNTIYMEGLHPGKEVLRSQLQLLKGWASEGLFITHSLSSYSEIYEAFDKKIAGISFVEIDSQSGFYILFFKGEIVFEKVWAGKPEKNYIKENGILQPSPRTSFSKWKNIVHGTSSVWNTKERHFIHRIREILRESLLQKSSEIESLNKQLIETNNALDTYAYTISHDLKNPLSAIKVSTEFIQYRQDLKPEILSKMTKNILESVNIILNMLDKIHQFSKASSFNYSKEIVEPEDFIPEIVEINRHRFGSNNLQVRINNLLPVQGEKILLYQLFLNLISNAIKYSSSVEQSLVVIESHQTDNGVLYLIEDNGIGIDKQELESIYEIFKRMSNAQAFEGSGVGMAIVKRITDKLGIDITIKSKLNEGTVVKLMFPV